MKKLTAIFTVMVMMNLTMTHLFAQSNGSSCANALQLYPAPAGDCNNTSGPQYAGQYQCEWGDCANYTMPAASGIDGTCTVDNDASQAGVWIKFVATANNATITNMTSISGPGGAALRARDYVVFSGACGSLTQIGCYSEVANGASNTISGLTAGQTYYIWVTRSNASYTQSSSTTYNIAATCLTSTVAFNPAGNACASPIVLTTNVTQPSTNANATANGPICSGSVENNVWYQWCCPAGWPVGQTAYINVNNQVCNSSSGLQLSVWNTNTTCPTSAADPDVICQNPGAQTNYYYTWTPVAGNCYYVTIDGFAATACSYDVTVGTTITAPCSITGTLSACVGGTSQLTGTGTPAASNPWVSSNTAVATVSNTGLVTALSAGTTTITYTNSVGCNTNVTFTVFANPTITGTLSACVGQTSTLTGSATAHPTTPWASSNTGVATISNGGVVTAVSAGTTTITYMNSNNCTVTATFTVFANPTITGTLSACVGQTSTLTGSATAHATTPWTSSNTGVATISSGGVVTAVSAGTTTITYRNTNNCTVTATFTVFANPTITGTLSACVGQTSTLTGSATAHATTPWASSNTGVATISSGGVVTAVSAGTSTITYMNSNNCTVTATFTVLASPTITGTLSACVGQTSTLTGSATAHATTPWASSNTGVATISSGGVVTAVSAGTTTITYMNTNNCTATATFTVNPTPTITGTLSACVGMTSSLSGTGTPHATTPWTSSNTGVATISSGGVVTAVSAGTTTITYMNTNNCSTSATFTVNPVPSITLTPNDPSVCNATDGSIQVNGVGTGNVNWSGTASGSAAGVTLPYNITSLGAGNYNVTFTNTTTGCTSASMPATLNNPGAPVINAMANVTNCGTSYTLLNSNITGTNLVAPAYYSSPGGVGLIPDGTVYSAPTPTTTIYVYDNNGSCTAQVSFTITINPIPTVTVNSPTICAGASATVTATPGTGGTYNYVWTVPGGASDPGNVATFGTTVPGTYSVIITNTATGCSSTSASGTVTSNPLPTVTVNSSTICSGASTSVTATPGMAGSYDYAWTVPGGVPAPGNVASFSTSTAGTYSVIITDQSTLCSSSSASGTVTVNPTPTVTVNSPAVCSGSSATITATPGSGGSYNYTWTVPGGVPAPGNVASFSASVAGTYSVIITDQVTLCSSTSASGTLTVNPNPTVSVSDATICSGASATVTATPGSAGTYNYNWTVPGGVSNPGNVSSFATNTAGTYSVILTDAVSGCSSTSESGTVSVNSNPTVTVNSASVCSGASATITATPGTAATYSYNWTVPGGATNPGDVNTFSATIAGNYSVIITNTTTTCVSSSASGTLTVNALPSVTVNSPSACQGSNATVTATPGSPGTYNYAWTIPAGATAVGNTGSFSTNTAGTYSVIITDQTTSCSSSSASGMVTMNPNPTVTVNDASICSGNSASLTATPGSAGAYDYSWTIPAGATNPGNVSSFNTSTPGVYAVVITDQGTGCSSASGAGNVTVNPSPTVTVNNPTACFGNPLTMTATAGSAGTFDYAWTVPSGATNPGNVNSFTTSTSGTYSVVITNQATGCSSNTVNGVVTINPIPAAPNAGTDATYCSTWTLVPMTVSGSGNATFTWYADAALSNAIGNGSQLTPQNVIGTTVYYVTQTVNGCVSPSNMVTIIVEGCEITIPTAFTPDNDGVNDFWEIVDLDNAYPNNQVTVFNRWGNMLYQSPKGAYSSDPWKGFYNNNALPVGSYYYIIDLNDDKGETKKGIVTIIKN